MDRRRCLQGALLIAAALQGCATAAQSSMASTAGLTNSVISQLGVSADQATGGIGSMLSYAKATLKPEQWATVASAIPGAGSYLQAASQLLGGDSVGSRDALDAAFTKLGMAPDMVKKFAPILSDFAGKTGGSAAKSLLAGLF